MSDRKRALLSSARPMPDFMAAPPPPAFSMATQKREDLERIQQFARIQFDEDLPDPLADVS